MRLELVLCAVVALLSAACDLGGTPDGGEGEMIPIVPSGDAADLVRAGETMVAARDRLILPTQPFQGSPGRSVISRDDTTGAASSMSHSNPVASSGPTSPVNCRSVSLPERFSSNWARVTRRPSCSIYAEKDSMMRSGFTSGLSSAVARSNR